MLPFQPVLKSPLQGRRLQTQPMGMGQASLLSQLLGPMPGCGFHPPLPVGTVLCNIVLWACFTCPGTMPGEPLDRRAMHQAHPLSEPWEERGDPLLQADPPRWCFSPKS